MTLIDIAEGLQQLDAISVVHRDVNPRNILYHDGRWKIADFGIARDEEIGTQSATWVGAGTPHYMAPELNEGKSPTKKVDLYSLGCIAYELLKGRPPYEGSDRWAIHEAHRTMDLPGDPCANAVLNHLIRRLLAKSPAERPQDATAVVEKLRHVPLSPTPFQQAIAQSLAAREAHKSREAAALAQHVAQAEARRQQVEQGIADLRALFEEAYGGIQGAAADIRLHQGTNEISVLIDDARLEVRFQETRPRLANDTMLILAWAHISTRNLSGFTAANFAYEQVGDRLAWTLYRFERSRSCTASDQDYMLWYGPINGTHGLHRDIFLEDRERVHMIQFGNIIHEWDVTIDELHVGSVVTLFQKAIELGL